MALLAPGKGHSPERVKGTYENRKWAIIYIGKGAFVERKEASIRFQKGVTIRGEVGL